MTERIKRFYDVIVKHNGKRVCDDINRAEFDFSIVYELLALEDRIQELEQELFDKKLEVSCLDLKIKHPNFGKRKKGK